MGVIAVKLQISTWLQNLGIACSMASLFTLFFRITDFAWVTKSVYYIPVFFVVLVLLGLVIAEDVRKAFKKNVLVRETQSTASYLAGWGWIYFLHGANWYCHGI